MVLFVFAGEVLSLLLLTCAVVFSSLTRVCLWANKNQCSHSLQSIFTIYSLGGVRLSAGVGEKEHHKSRTLGHSRVELPIVSVSFVVSSGCLWLIKIFPSRSFRYANKFLDSALLTSLYTTRKAVMISENSSLPFPVHPCHEHAKELAPFSHSSLRLSTSLTLLAALIPFCPLLTHKCRRNDGIHSLPPLQIDRCSSRRFLRTHHLYRFRCLQIHNAYSLFFELLFSLRYSDEKSSDYFLLSRCESHSEKKKM